MSIKYKIDVIAALKDAGYSSYRIRKEAVFGQATLQKLRDGEQVSWNVISQLCQILRCQPGDILEYTEEESKGAQDAEKH